MNSTAKAVVQRVKQARSAVVKIEATWAGFQFLLAVGPIGVLIGLVVWARRRRTRGEPARVDTATAPVTDAETTGPVAAASAKVPANGLVN